jgi:hypothetical protein
VAISGWFDVKTKKEIVDNWLPRYTGTTIESFGDYFLLTNFGNYLEIFAERTGAEISWNVITAGYPLGV